MGKMSAVQLAMVTVTARKETVSSALKARAVE